MQYSPRNLLPSRPRPVGIYGLPRGGTNLISAWLHYHPQVFCVSERKTNPRKPLWRYWKKRSILRTHGRQGKSYREVRYVVFNKVQRQPAYWGPQPRVPEGTPFIFYIRNPVRVQLSRDRFHRRHDPDRTEWADTPANFERLLTEFEVLFHTADQLTRTYPCLVLSHEYFCCRHEAAVRHVLNFLDLDPSRFLSPREFFQRCGQCGGPLTTTFRKDGPWLMCGRCHTLIKGHGNFNPLKEIDVENVRSESWKRLPEIDQRMHRLQTRLGEHIADYYWHGRFDENIGCLPAVRDHRPHFIRGQPHGKVRG